MRHIFTGQAPQVVKTLVSFFARRKFGFQLLFSRSWVQGVFQGTTTATGDILFTPVRERIGFRLNFFNVRGIAVYIDKPSKTAPPTVLNSVKWTGDEQTGAYARPDNG